MKLNILATFLSIVILTACGATPPSTVTEVPQAVVLEKIL